MREHIDNQVYEKHIMLTLSVDPDGADPSD